MPTTAEWICTRCGSTNRKLVADGATHAEDECVTCHTKHEIEADPRYPVTADFMRAAHTLTSTSRTTGFDMLAEVSASLEKWLQACMEVAPEFDARRVRATREAVDTLASMVQSVGAHALPHPREDVISELNLLRERVNRHAASRQFIAGSEAMQHVLELAARVAPLDTTVLVYGESGTGKEFVVRLIHDQSPRAAAPFVSINCAALTESLLESELFGHERGAFTGADSRRIGRFEQASGGTIFLDEIGDMNLPLQAKLLRVLQEKTIQRVGGKESISIDVRVIAATHRDLEMAIQERSFREDLFYRLNVVTINLPPLHERKEDIPELARYFLKKYEFFFSL